MQESRFVAVRLAVLLALADIAPAAGAEVWGYVDADGTAHVATGKLDERYQLFFKGKSNAELQPLPPPADTTALDALRATPICRRMVEHPNIKRYQASIDRNAKARGLDAALVKALLVASRR